jgi:hypothetical protein
MNVIRFEDTPIELRAIGYSALGMYVLSVGLYIGSAISMEFHGASLIVCLVMALIALAMPPLEPDSCLSINNKRIWQRLGMFSCSRIRWDKISRLTMDGTRIKVDRYDGVQCEIPLYFLSYGKKMSIKQTIKVHALRKGIPVEDTEL